MTEHIPLNAAELDTLWHHATVNALADEIDHRRGVLVGNWVKAADVMRLIAEVRRLRAAQTWQPIETAPKDGSSVLLYIKGIGCVEAWFYAGEWSEETPETPREYTGDAWVCADDAFQVEVELGPDHEYHGNATHWMPCPEPPDGGSQ